MYRVLRCERGGGARGGSSAGAIAVAVIACLTLILTLTLNPNPNPNPTSPCTPNQVIAYLLPCSSPSYLSYPYRYPYPYSL